MSTLELAWTITHFVFNIAIMVITGTSFAYFVRPYLQSKKGAVYIGLTYFLVMLALYFIPVPFDNFTAYSIGILAAFLVMYAKERSNVEQKIFLAVTFFSLRWLSMAMAAQIYITLYKGILMRETMAERPWLQYGIYVSIIVLDVGSSLLFIAVSINLLNRAFEYKKANMTKRELLMLVIPSLSSMIGYGVLQSYQKMYEHDTGRSLDLSCGIYGYLSSVYYVLSFVSILVMIVVFQNVKARQEENARQELLQSQIADMKKHIGEVEKLYKDIRMLRHDMGNHIQTIDHLLGKNEKEEAFLYTAKLKQEWQEISCQIKSGNPVTDVILLEKKKEAEERNIRFECGFHYPEGTKLNAFDISVILNNALDNSLESANGDSPYIHISSYRKNNMFMIVISNSFVGSVVLDEDTELPVSTKQDVGHGLGLANIRRVARKYLGDIAFEQEEGTAVLTAMLQLQ